MQKANEGFELTGGDRNILSFVFDALGVPTNVVNNRNIMLNIFPMDGLLAEKGKTLAMDRIAMRDRSECMVQYCTYYFLDFSLHTCIFLSTKIKGPY